MKKKVKISNSLITRLLEGPTTAKLRLPPQNRSFSTCSFRQTATFTGSDDRIEPNYFQHTHVDFLAENNFDCFLIFWVPLASPGSPGRSRTKKPGKHQKYQFLRKNPKIMIFPEIVISGSAAPGPKGPLNTELRMRQTWTFYNFLHDEQGPSSLFKGPRTG